MCFVYDFVFLSKINKKERKENNVFINCFTNSNRIVIYDKQVVCFGLFFTFVQIIQSLQFGDSKTTFMVK